MSTEHELDYRYRGGEWTWFVRSCKTGRFRAGDAVTEPGSVIVTCVACGEIAYSAVAHVTSEQDSEPTCVTDERGIALGVGESMRLVRWWGPFQENWIASRADAADHNIEKHPTPIPTWEEIIHGREEARA